MIKVNVGEVCLSNSDLPSYMLAKLCTVVVINSTPYIIHGMKQNKLSITRYNVSNTFSFYLEDIYVLQYVFISIYFISFHVVSRLTTFYS